MSDTLYERSNSADDSNASIGGSTAWEGQTFTPSIQHTVTSVKLFLYRDDGVLPGTVTVSIRNTSAGLPTGADLVSGTFNGDTATTSGAGNWEEFTFTGSTTQLAASTTYAIAIRVSAATAQIKSKATNPGQYTGGTAVSSGDSGGTWTVYGNGFDYQFEEYGYPLPGEGQGLLAVVGETLHYVSKTGVEYVVQGTVV